MVCAAGCLHFCFHKSLKGEDENLQLRFDSDFLFYQVENQTLKSPRATAEVTVFLFTELWFFFFFSDLANVLRHCHSSLVLCSKRLGLFFCISCLDVFKLSSTGSSALSPQGLFPLPFHFLRVCKREEDWVALWWNVEMWGWIPDTLLALLPVLRDLSGWLTFSWECLQIVCSSVGESS